MFNIGQKVVHPSTGACVIEDITIMRVEGHKRDYYKLCPVLSNKATVYVPLKSGKGNRIRPVITLGDLKDMGMDYEGMDYKWIADSKERIKSITSTIKAADFFENMLLIKMLKKRSEEKPLSYGDRKSLHEAEEMVCSELAAVTGKSYESVMEEMQFDTGLGSFPWSGEAQL